jgi:tetratricopeptide (TPR) repeat protein
MSQKEITIAALEQAVKEGYTFKIKELLEAARAEFGDADFLQFYQAEYHIQAWEYPAALAILQELYDAAPENSRYGARLAVALLKNQKTDEAIALFEQLTEENPDDVGLFYTFGKEVTAVCWQGEELRKAIAALTHVITLDETYAPAYAERATAYQNIGSHDKALADLNKVIEAAPENNNGYLRRIALNIFLEDDEAVQKDYEYLIAANPDDFSHLYNFAQYFYKQNEFEQAITQLNKEIEVELSLGWTPTGALALRGEVYYFSNQLEAALADLNAVLNEDPQNSGALKIRALTYRDLGKDADFLADIADGLGKESIYKDELLRLRAEYYFAQGQIALAKADYNLFLTDEKFAFNKKDGYFGLGCIAQAEGDLAHAYENWVLAKENYHEEAENYIEQYCSSFIEQQSEAKGELIRQEFEGEAEKNQNSAILSQIFGKTWGIDIELTKEKSPAINQLPQGLVAFFMEAFRSIALTITPELLTLANPAHGDIVAYYRITEETEKEVHLYNQPIGNHEPRQLSIGIDGENLRVSGLMSNVSQDTDSIHLLFKIIDADEQKEAAEESEARMKKMAENFIGELLSTVVEGLESIGDMISPKGESASDDAPPQGK